MLLHCSSMMAGARHDNDQYFPVIVLGGAGGAYSWWPHY